MGAVAGIIIAILYIAFIVFIIYCYCRISKRAGYSPWAGLLMLIPLVNFVIPFYFAFTTWPIEKGAPSDANVFN
jgi:hypothetical protein